MHETFNYFENACMTRLYSCLYTSSGGQCLYEFVFLLSEGKHVDWVLHTYRIFSIIPWDDPHDTTLFSLWYHEYNKALLCTLSVNVMDISAFACNSSLEQRISWAFPVCPLQSHWSRNAFPVVFVRKLIMKPCAIVYSTK